MKLKNYLFICAFSAIVCSLANAQGSNFVLLGGSGEQIPPEKRTVRPLTAPYFHEDAFVTTDVRAWFIYHELAEIAGDGNVDVVSLQARLAVTDNFQVLAYKSGYANYSQGSTLGDEGWNDLGLGVKWALFQDIGSQLFIAIGAGYELGVGDDQVFQDTDEYRFWASVNKGFGKLHLGATANYIIAGDGKLDGLAGNADLLTLHFHADYYVTSWFSPVFELNGYFVQEANSTISTLPPGNGNFSGVDIASINGGDSDDTITYAFGFEVRPLDESLGLRVAYETQLNNYEDSLFGYRWTFSGVYEF